MSEESPERPTQDVGNTPDIGNESGEWSQANEALTAGVSPPKKPEVVQGGWGEAPKSGRRGEGGKGGNAGEAFDPRLEMDAPDMDNESGSEEDPDDDGVYIPTLEEANEEALTSQVAQAPSQNIAYISYADLERNAVATMPFMSTDAGIDIKLLTDVLSPPDKIIEPDEAWEFEGLWYTITGELEDEKEAKESKPKEEGEGVSNAL
eukprot:gene7280-15020_t